MVRMSETGEEGEREKCKQNKSYVSSTSFVCESVSSGRNVFIEQGGSVCVSLLNCWIGVRRSCCRWVPAICVVRFEWLCSRHHQPIWLIYSILFRALRGEYTISVTSSGVRHLWMHVRKQHFDFICSTRSSMADCNDIVAVARHDSFHFILIFAILMPVVIWKSVFTCASTCFMFNVHVSSECTRKKKWLRHFELKPRLTAKQMIKYVMHCLTARLINWIFFFNFILWFLHL